MLITFSLILTSHIDNSTVAENVLHEMINCAAQITHIYRIFTFSFKSKTKKCSLIWLLQSKNYAFAQFRVIVC